MNTRGTTSQNEELQLACGILDRMSTDLSMIIDRELHIEGVQVERRNLRPVGGSQVHISFRFDVEQDGETRQGCFLVPLPEAVSLAGFMMMRSDEEVARERTRTELDRPFKEALLEVGKFLAGACDAVLRRYDAITRPAGCQGVRADVRPALDYHDGDPLLVARARARLHEFESFELLLILPGLEPARLETTSV